jgi:SAM-dependent methyltransferase
MAMNRFHRRYCDSAKWAEAVEERLLPWALADLDLGPDVLEIGPGFGATTRVLAPQVKHLTAVEVDKPSADRLHRELGPGVTIVHGDGAELPFPDDSFSAVLCFTMLHHVPSAAAQDEIFAEAARVLRPGGVFAGSDSVTSWRFRLIHLGDTRVEVPPETLPDRLRDAGFTAPEVSVSPTGGSFRFRARQGGSGTTAPISRGPSPAP